MNECSGMKERAFPRVWGGDKPEGGQAYLFRHLALDRIDDEHLILLTSDQDFACALRRKAHAS